MNAISPELSLKQAGVVRLMHVYQDGSADSSLTLPIIHKLAYLLQSSGEPLGTLYVDQPYARRINQLLDPLWGRFIGGTPDDIELLPGSLQAADALLKEHPEDKAIVQEVIKLICGFRSPQGLGLLAWVHWALVRGVAPSAKEILRHHEDHGAPEGSLSLNQVSAAMCRLSRRGWVKSATDASLRGVVR